MKKIVIVNNNMKVGGVQKSLLSLLWEIRDRYDITLLLFSPIGAYMDELPPEIKVRSCGRLFETLGKSQGEYQKKDPFYWVRGALAALAKVFGRRFALGLMTLFGKRIRGEYDCAISFLHNADPKIFYGGVNEFVWHKIRAKRKIAFLHCDYLSSGANHRSNNRLYARFDAVAACSEGCRQAFLKAMPQLEDRCFRVRNCIAYDEVRRLAAQDTQAYDPEYITILTVARLGREKGVDRALRAIAYATERGMKIHFHIVGNGKMMGALREQTCHLGLDSVVFFHGEQVNPYRYMKNAQLLLITSYHEAAPLVVDEAGSLGLPILSVRTTSSEEMLTRTGSGWVCENDQDSLNRSLLELLRQPGLLAEKKRLIRSMAYSNETARNEFMTVLEG